MQMGQLQYAHMHYVPLTSIEENGCMTAGEVVNFTTIQCVHEQSLTGVCIFPVFVFASNGSPMYKSLTKTKHTQSLKYMKY